MENCIRWGTKAPTYPNDAITVIYVSWDLNRSIMYPLTALLTHMVQCHPHHQASEKESVEYDLASAQAALTAANSAHEVRLVGSTSVQSVYVWSHVVFM